MDALPHDDFASRLVPSESDACAHLILNDELPVRVGSGTVEYHTTLHLPSHFSPVGLVSIAHRRLDLARAQGLCEAGAQLYVWHGPAFDAPVSAPSARPPRTHTLVRRAHALISDLMVAARAHGRPFEVSRADAQFRNMSAPLLAALRDRSWPTLSVVQSHAAHFLRYVPKPAVSVLVLHDLKAVVYSRRAALAAGPLARWRLRREAARMERFERDCCREYDLVVTVSDVDTAIVRERYGAAHVLTRRLPVDASYWRPSPATRRPSPLVVFTGLMNHPPNVDAAVFMAREILPVVRREVPDAVFRVVGRNPAPEVLALAELPGVEVTGEVPDVRPHLDEAAVVVVPLRFGSGARQKILEAWAMQKCIVSTGIGVEGLDALDGQHLAVADGVEAFAAKVVRGLRDEAWRSRLGREGRPFVIARHDPAALTAEFARAIKQTRERTRAASADAPMRVAIDMRWMLPGLAGGIEQVARAFLRELLPIDRYNRYTLIVPARVAASIDLRRNPNVRCTSLDGAAAYASRLHHAVRGRVLGRLRLDNWLSAEVRQLRWLRSLDARLVYAFPGYVHPDLQPLPQVLMVPDIQHEYCPEFFDGQALEERTRLYRDSIARAAHLCAISEFTRQTLIERLGVAPDRVTSIPLAADPAFTATPGPGDSAVLGRHGLSGGGYFFFPGHSWRHKNHVTAVRALAIASDRHGLRLPLVCTGGAREAQPAIEREIETLGLAGSVRQLGYVPRADLPVLYRHAAALVFPSIFEGFGMPVLEAMASGCPVVCSNTTSLPEIAGDAAVLVNPLDADAIADAMAAVVRDRDRRTQLVDAGVRRAPAYSWRRHTLDTLRVLRQVHCSLD